jgi:hypothetical protein
MDFIALGRRLFLNNRRRKRRIDCGFAPVDADGATEIDDFFVFDEDREKSDIRFGIGLHTGEPIAGLSAADRLSQLGYLRSARHRSRNPGADNLPVIGRRRGKRRRGWRGGCSLKLRTGQDAGTSGSQRGQKNGGEELLRASIPALAHITDSRRALVSRGRSRRHRCDFQMYFDRTPRAFFLQHATRKSIPAEIGGAFKQPHHLTLELRTGWWPAPGSVDTHLS